MGPQICTFSEDPHVGFCKLLLCMIFLKLEWLQNRCHSPADTSKEAPNDLTTVHHSLNVGRHALLKPERGHVHTWEKSLECRHLAQAAEYLSTNHLWKPYNTPWSGHNCAYATDGATGSQWDSLNFPKTQPARSMARVYFQVLGIPA